jgi:hypothetical protein
MAHFKLNTNELIVTAEFLDKLKPLLDGCYKEYRDYSNGKYKDLVRPAKLSDLGVTIVDEDLMFTQLLMYNELDKG